MVTDVEALKLSISGFCSGPPALEKKKILRNVEATAVRN
jgi:hypothetical protein